MKFKIYSPNSGYAAIEANNFGHAAKTYAEHGHRGPCWIYDETGAREYWDLQMRIIHYAYRAPEPG